MLLLSGCSKQQDNFLLSKNCNKIIALQPLGGYDTEQLNFINQVTGGFYDRKVLILKPIAIPSSFRIKKDVELYSADSILGLLPNLLTGDIMEVIGLTHKEIYTLNKEKNNTGNPLFDYSVQSIFGLGDFPGKCCLISDFNFKTNNTSLLKHRLRKVILHEIGHNLGLNHCKLYQCIMSDQNSKIPTLDYGSNDYCSNCKSKLYH